MPFNKPQSFALSVVTGVILAVGALSLTDTASAKVHAMPVEPESSVPTHPVLAALAERYPVASSSEGFTRKGIDGDVDKVLELYRQNALKSFRDYSIAAGVLGNSSRTEDVLLSHEMAAAAVAMGSKTSGSLLAWTIDRYLAQSQGRQRFGTLRTKEGKDEVPVQAGVSDHLRRALGVPSLADLRRSGFRSPALVAGTPMATTPRVD